MHNKESSTPVDTTYS